MAKRTGGKKTSFGADLIEGMKVVLAHQLHKVVPFEPALHRSRPGWLYQTRKARPHRSSAGVCIFCLST
jgi:hypothetical protein